DVSRKVVDAGVGEGVALAAPDGRGNAQQHGGEAVACGGGAASQVRHAGIEVGAAVHGVRCVGEKLAPVLGEAGLDAVLGDYLGGVHDALVDMVAGDLATGTDRELANGIQAGNRVEEDVALKHLDAGLVDIVSACDAGVDRATGKPRLVVAELGFQHGG